MKLFLHAAVVFVALAEVARVSEAFVVLDPTVLCDPVVPFACAHREILGPSPACDETGNCTYIGESRYTFFFTSQALDGTVPDPHEAFDNGLVTTVHWENGICGGEVDAEACSSCEICSAEELNETFSFDCTNIPSGVATDCQSISPVFYPLDETYNYPASPLNQTGLIPELYNGTEPDIATGPIPDLYNGTDTADEGTGAGEVGTATGDEGTELPIDRATNSAAVSTKVARLSFGIILSSFCGMILVVIN